MEVTLNLIPRSPVLLYLQVKVFIKKEILEGRYEKGFQLPPISRVAKQNSVSTITVRRAYWELEKEGYITRERTNAYFVRDRFLLIGQLADTLAL
ncbi:GntR family transcriptional regulator [Pedobacter superstes]|uniref:GntR family transcriptional regulator n=1 Tax=Pedobacter superstes TaxID=3133441 RepID=UPI003D753DD2